MKLSKTAHFNHQAILEDGELSFTAKGIASFLLVREPSVELDTIMSRRNGQPIGEVFRAVGELLDSGHVTLS